MLRLRPIGDPRKLGSRQRGIGGDLQIRQHLVHAVRRDRADASRLSEARDQQGIEVLAESVEPRFTGGIAERQHRNGDGRSVRRGRFGRRRRRSGELAPREITPSRQHDERHGGRGETTAPRKRRGPGQRGLRDGDAVPSHRLVDHRDHLVHRLPARGGVGLQTPGDERVEPLGNRRIAQSQCRRRAPHPLHQFRDRRARAAVAAAGQHVVQNQPERVDVGALVDGLALRLFRRHVLDRADDGSGDRHADARARRRSRDAEVHDERAVFVIQHDVGGLEIAMDDAGLVCRGETGGNVPGDLEHSIEGQPPLLFQDGRQIRSVHVRHRDVGDAVDLAQIVNADDVAMRDLPGEQQFALEALLERLRLFRIRSRFWSDHLDGNRHLERLVPGLVDRAHAALAEDTNDVIPRAEVVPHRQGEGSGDREGSRSDRRTRV